MTSYKPPPNPYIGPRAFSQAESKFFFGRDTEIQVVMGLVLARRATLFFAQSGAGKSSLLHAGLIPRLIQAETVGRGRRKRARHKMDVLMASVGGAAAEGSSENVFVVNALASLHRMQADAKTALELGQDEEVTTIGAGLAPFMAALAAESGGENRPVLLIFDQFEEIFTQNTERWRERTYFFEQVNSAVERFPRLHILFSMREDFIAEMTPYLHLIHDQLRSRYRMERLQEEAAFAAIQMPAKAVDIRFEDDAVTELLSDLRAEEQYIEPVQLQVACHNLWVKLERDDMLADGISKEDVQQLGDVSAALANYYCDTISRIASTPDLHVSERKIREWIDTKLISPQGIRIQVLREPVVSGDLPTRVALLIEDAHLIRLESRRKATFFELSHDRLVEPVRIDNKRWREENLNSILQVQARLWHRSGESPDLLLRDEELANAQSWAREHEADLVAYEQAYLEACAAEQTRLAQARLLQEKELEQAKAKAVARQRLLGLMGIFLIVAMVLAFIANQARSEAVAAETEAVRQSELAAASRGEAEAALLIAETSAAEAVRQANLAATSEAEAVRLANLAATREADAVAAEIEAVRQANLAATREAEALVQQARAEESEALAESQRLAFAARDASNNQELALLLAIEAVRASPSERAQAELNRIMQNEASSFRSLLDGDETADSIGAISRVAYSPEGRWLLLINEEAGLAQVWRVATGQWITTITHESAITAFAYANATDGTWLATGSRDGEVKLFALPFSSGPDDQTAPRENREPLATTRLSQGVATLTFIPQESGFRLSSIDYALDVYQLWNVNTLSTAPADAAVEAISSVPLNITLATVAPNRQVAALATDLGQVFLRQLTGERLLLNTSVDQGPLIGLRFDPTSRLLVSTGSDNTIQIWLVSGQPESPLNLNATTIRLDEQISAPPVFNASGSLLAVGTSDGTVRLFSVSDGAFITSLSQRHVGGVTAMQFNPTRSLLATAAGSGDVYLWDTVTFSLENSYGAHVAAVRDLTFNPGGAGLTTASDDTSVQIRTIESDVLSLSGHENSVYGLAMRPGAGAPILVSTSGDGSVRLWSLGATLGASQNSGAFAPIMSDDSLFTLVDFSPDGTLFAFGNSESEVELWQVTDESAGTVSQVGVISVRLGTLYAVTFSPDGQWLAVGTSVGVVGLWRVSDIATGDNAPPLVTFEAEEPGDLYGVAFNFDSSYLIFTHGITGDLYVWDVAAAVASEGTDGLLAAFNPHNSDTVGLGASSTENILITANSVGQLFVWDIDELAGGSEMPLATWSGSHEDLIVTIRFTPDGTAFATGGVDGQLLLWNTAAASQREATSSLYQELITAEESEAGTYATAFSNDGHWLFVGLENGRIVILALTEATGETSSQAIERLLDAACTAAGRNMSYNEWGRYFPPEAFRATCPQFPLNLESLLESAREAAFAGEFDQADVIIAQAQTLAPENDSVAAAAAEIRELATAFFTARAIDLALTGDIVGAEAAIAAGFERGLDIDINIDVIVAGAAIRANVEAAAESNDAALMTEQAAAALALADTYINFFVCTRARAAGLDAAVSDVCAAALAQAQPITTDGVAVSGNVFPYSGEAWLFTAPAGQQVTIDLGASDSSLDAYLELVGPEGIIIAADDDGGDGLNSRLVNFILPTDGDYVILARGFGTSGGGYQLRVRLQDPDVETRINILLNDAYAAIDAGDLDTALALLTAATEIDDSEGNGTFIQGDVRDNPEQFVLWSYLTNGIQAAQSFDIEAAVGIFEDLVNRNPALPLDPLTTANAPQINSLLGAGAEVEQLSTADEDALKLAVDLALLTDDPRLLYDVCFAGAGLRRPDLVVAACEAAVTATGTIPTAGSVNGIIPVFGGAAWSYTAAAGDIVTIALDRDGECVDIICLDPYLRLIGPGGNLIASDDDSGGDLNSLISSFVIPGPGTYVIIAHGYGESGGAYTLTVSTSPAPSP